MTLRPKKRKERVKVNIKKEKPMKPSLERQSDIKKHLAKVKPLITAEFVKHGHAKSKAEADALYDAYSAAVKLRYYEYEWKDIVSKVNSIIGPSGFIDTEGY